MAMLSATTGGRLSVYTPQVLELINKSMNKDTGFELSFIIGKRTPRYWIKKDPINETTLNKYAKLALTKEADALALKLTVIPNPAQGDDKEISFRNLSKELIRAVKFNKGNVSEGILAAAITARFKDKYGKIENKDVYATIAKFQAQSDGKKQKVVAEFDSPNRNTEITDKVTCKISLAKSNMKALLDKDIMKSLENFVSGAVVYANGTQITHWAELLYENDTYDEIVVDSDGLVDEKGTKVDLRLKIKHGKGNNREFIKAVNISLKAGDVKQFGQVSGSEYKNMVDMFDLLIPFAPLENDNPLKKDHTKLLAADNSIGATILIYDTVKKRLNEQITKDANNIKNSSSLFLKSLSNFINFHATRNEDNVDMLHLNKQDAKLYKFEHTSKILEGMELNAGIRSSHSNTANADISRLVIKKKGAGVNDKKNTLLTIRMKLDSQTDGFYHRNYVEKGDLMEILSAEEYLKA